MTKQEIFAAHLPHGVEVEVWYNKNESERFKLDRLIEGGDVIQNDGCEFQIDDEEYYKVFLLLHPLSRLTQPIKHPKTGEEIVNPLEWIVAHAYPDSKEKFVELYNSAPDGSYGRIMELVKKSISDFLCGIQGDFYKPRLSINDILKILSLADELHFDTRNAIGKGYAKEIEG